MKHTGDWTYYGDEDIGTVSYWPPYSSDDGYPTRCVWIVYLGLDQ